MLVGVAHADPPGLPAPLLVLVDVVPRVAEEAAERIRAKLVQVLSQPVISGGQATVVLDDEILAAKLGSLGEDLYQSGVAKSRPRVEERNGRWAVVMRQQSFTELVAFLGRPR